jgi:hypothetical protein
MKLKSRSKFLPKGGVLVPARWWIDGGRAMGLRLLLQVRTDEADLAPKGAAWPLGNSYDPGFVCFGGNPRPKNVDDADRVFFSTPFNNAYSVTGWKQVVAKGGIEAWLVHHGDIHDVLDDIKRTLMGDVEFM